MTKQSFIVTLQDNIVLNSNSATTMGTSDTLDYIPGSNFLGIVANDGGYKSFGNNAFEVFYSGKVRFGDAHLYNENNMQSYKIPFCYFLNKGENIKQYRKIYFHHKLTSQDRENLRKNDIQLKQVRNGYFDTQGNIYSIKYNYTQKSAYDKTSRRSKDSSMFGYNAIKRGTKFVFEVTFEDEKHKQNIINRLVGIKRLGKSKNNQFGRVEIQTFNNTLKTIDEQPDTNITLLYAKSNLALIDDEANPLLTPTSQSLNLPDGIKIDFEKSQIRTKSYSPYNSTRDSRDYERVIIQKGSVIALKGKFDTKSYKQTIKNGVGAYLSEGFGEILINPKFLFEVKFNELTKKDKILGIDIKDKLNSNLQDYLSLQAKQKQDNKELLQLAYENRDKFDKNTTSQWGKIRELATIYGNDEILDELATFLNKGVAKDKWKDDFSKLKKLLNKEEIKQKSRFTKLLAMEVSRYLKQGGK